MTPRLPAPTTSVSESFGSRPTSRTSLPEKRGLFGLFAGSGSSGALGCGLLIDSRRFDDNAVERLDSAYSLACRASRSGQAGHGGPAARVVPAPRTNWAGKWAQVQSSLRPQAQHRGNFPQALTHLALMPSCASCHSHVPGKPIRAAA